MTAEEKLERDQVFEITLTPAERATLAARAEMLAIPFDEYLKRRLMTGLPQLAVEVADEFGLPKTPVTERMQKKGQ